MYRLLKQPNNKYCIFDTVIDKIIYINITDKEIDNLEQRVQDLWYDDNGKPCKTNELLMEYIKDFSAYSLDMETEDFRQLATVIKIPTARFVDLRYKYKI